MTEDLTIDDLEYFRGQLLLAESISDDSGPMTPDVIKKLTLFQLRALKYQLEGAAAGYLPIDRRLYIPPRDTRPN